MTTDFDALFDTFTHSAYRLETLPAYAIPAEDPSYLAFQHGLPRPERSVRTSPWMRRIAVTTAAGKKWSRTRVVDTPLTDYQRFQLPAYLESQTVGERIDVVPRDVVGDLGPDFWLFDAFTDHAHAALMHYTDTGEFEGFTLVTDPDEIAELEHRRDLATLHDIDGVGAVSLAEFMATLGGGCG